MTTRLDTTTSAPITNTVIGVAVCFLVGRLCAYASYSAVPIAVISPSLLCKNTRIGEPSCARKMRGALRIHSVVQTGEPCDTVLDLRSAGALFVQKEDGQ
jgi:hypothetical protein